MSTCRVRFRWLPTAREKVKKSLFFAETIVLDAVALKNFIDYGTHVLPVPKEIDDELYKVASGYFDEQAAGDPYFAKVIASERAFKALCDLQNIQ